MHKQTRYVKCTTTVITLVVGDGYSNCICFVLTSICICIVLPYYGSRRCKLRCLPLTLSVSVGVELTSTLRGKQELSVFWIRSCILLYHVQAAVEGFPIPKCKESLEFSWAPLFTEVELILVIFTSESLSE